MTIRRKGQAAVDLPAKTFRTMGHRLVDDVATLLEGLPERKVAPGKRPSEVKALLGGAAIPENGADPVRLLAEATALLADNSTFNGHPRFFGYITASPTPIGILSEMLAAAINPNCGGYVLSPLATEIELQTIRWMAELTGFARDCGGLFVSGGNMANMVGFLVAKAKAEGDPAKLRCYASAETHTWIDKAPDMFGLTDQSVVRLPVDPAGRISADAIRTAIESDRNAGMIPFLVIATAGTTNTGAIDPIGEIADLCESEKLWLHVDGAYGAPAASIANAPEDLKHLGRADSLAIDPHKWLYAPLEAGCALVKNAEDLRTTFSHHPPYYHFDDIQGEEGTNMYEYGPQNSRGFRALKVWLAMKQVGRAGAVKMIEEDIALTKKMYEAILLEPQLEAFTCELSIVTFRFVPEDLSRESASDTEYLNKLNEELQNALQAGGEIFLSNGTLDGRFLLRACIVNFRTTDEDVLVVPEVVVRVGERVDRELRKTR